MSARETLKKVIDMRGGAYGASLLAASVWIMNMITTSPPDLFGSTTAALKQWVYTFLVGGILFRLLTRLALRPGSAFSAVTAATLLPGSFACGLTYFVHSLKGTPAPFMSTLPTILLAVLGMPLIAIHIRRKGLKGATNINREAPERRKEDGQKIMCPDESKPKTSAL